jgi:hypothetical protein
MLSSDINNPKIIHYEYRFFHEHVQNIVRNPFHEAYFMGIDNRWVSREDLMIKCFARLVLAHSDLKHYQDHVQNIMKDPYHEGYVLAIDNRIPREQLVWECFNKVVFIPQQSSQILHTSNIVKLEEPLTLSPSQTKGPQ